MCLRLFAISIAVVFLSLSLVKLNKRKTEQYESKITMSLPQWRKFVGSGMNTLLLSGGVIPSGTVNTGWGGNSGAVYSGHVRQGWGS